MRWRARSRAARLGAVSLFVLASTWMVLRSFDRDPAGFDPPSIVPPSELPSARAPSERAEPFETRLELPATEVEGAQGGRPRSRPRWLSRGPTRERWVEGHAIDEAGRPVSAADVVLRYPGHGVSHAVTGPDGRFAFRTTRAPAGHPPVLGGSITLTDEEGRAASCPVPPSGDSGSRMVAY